jgi:hypothetical protein
LKRTKKSLLVILICMFTNNLYSQILPLNRYKNNSYYLDLTPQNPSFAYSLRKLKTNYEGYAIRIRRSSDNAEADVNFDSFEMVSIKSNVTITNSGSGVLIIGQSTDYDNFVGTDTIFVTIWYDQGSNLYNAVQTSYSKQPEIKMNVAGSSNTLPSIAFNGSQVQHLSINQPIENLVGVGVLGTMMLVVKPTQNSSQLSFGYVDEPKRWNCHINWSDGYCYFDASENCCASNRSFENGASINIYKQYSFIRTINAKTARLNNNSTSLDNSPEPALPLSGGTFSIGAWSEVSHNGFYGNCSEVILFPIDISISNIDILERNQIIFWQL